MNKPLIISILLIAFVLRFLVIVRNDEMYDEVSVVRSGEIYIGGIKNLDFSHNIWIVNYEHPPMAKYIFGIPGFIEHRVPAIHDLVDKGFHKDKGYFLAKLVSAFIGVLTIFFVYYITTKWFDERKAFFSALFLALMPHFIGHNAVAGLETPQALFSLLLVYFYIEGLFRSSKPDFKKIYLSFLFFALLFLTKFSGLFFVFFYIFTYGYYLFKKKTFSRNLLLINVSGIFFVAFLIYMLWPWIWPNPLNLLKSFGYFRNAHSGEYFLGSLGQPGWYYYFTYFTATTQPLVLLSFLITILYFVLGKVPQNHKQYLVLTFAWFLTPFLISFVGLKQDGIRYVFSYFPALAIIAGYGFATFIHSLNQKIRPIIAVIAICSVMWSLSVFTPYYLDYYNIFYGGTRNVYKSHLFDYAWWGEGIHEAVDYVNSTFADKNLSVIQLLYPQHTAPLYDERLKFYDKYDPLNPPDLILISEYHHYYNSPELKILENYNEIHSVKVDDTPLVRIYRKK